MMEEVRTLIVGAGPAGLVLALSLEQLGINTLILEKEQGITQDPRGVYLAGDAIRILWSLGLGKEMPCIGHELHEVNFHRSTFASPPFHSLNLRRDDLQQAVPTGVLQIQPALEKALRDRVYASKFCELRVGCEVQQLTETDNGVEVIYSEAAGALKNIRTSWLIGADGKRGVVRKTFLEKVARIRQVDSDYRYEGTWVAANLKISLPTPNSHPEFPAWASGLTPRDVYDLFWPKGWHFCSPPGKPTASGRFGPHEERLWRHEFRQDKWDEKSMDAEQLLWDHLMPMISRTEDAHGKSFGQTFVYPRDCIEVLRCRPFTFAHKVVNNWFHGRSILIGDAAHVFPPFGGQGIASGIRDAHQLAWRIAMLEKMSPSPKPQIVNRVLEAWAKERAHSIKNAAGLTRMNGLLCNEGTTLWVRIIQFLQWFQQTVLWQKEPWDPQISDERRGFQDVLGGFFLENHGGGRRLPQIYVDSIENQVFLSDELFAKTDSPLRLLAFVHGNEQINFGHSKLQKLLVDYRIPDTLLSPDAMVIFSLDPCTPSSIGSSASPTIRKACPTPQARLNNRHIRIGYDLQAFESRLGKGVSYAIVRPDFYVFATAKDLSELEVCFVKLRGILVQS